MKLSYITFNNRKRPYWGAPGYDLRAELDGMVASDDSGAYYGQFMTDLEVNDARRAFEVGTWGRHRWLIETSFKTEKREGEDGFGLEHTFCKDENASRAMHLQRGGIGNRLHEPRL